MGLTQHYGSKADRARGVSDQLRRGGVITFGIAASLVAAVPASAALIDVQFSGQYQQVGPAVVGSAGDLWNLFGQNETFGMTIPATGTSGLLNVTGANIGLSISYFAPVGYTAGSMDSAFAGTPYANLMQGVLASSSTGLPISITIAGLAPLQGYQLDIFTQGDSGSVGRSIDVSVNGKTQRNTQTGSSRFIANDNYTEFSGFTDEFGNLLITGLDVPGSS